MRSNLPKTNIILSIKQGKNRRVIRLDNKLSPLIYFISLKLFSKFKKAFY